MWQKEPKEDSSGLVFIVFVGQGGQANQQIDSEEKKTILP